MVIDIGVSFHMTPHRDLFCSCEPYQGGTMRMGDDTMLDIIDRKNVKLKMKNGTIKNLQDMIHILGLTRILISVGTMANASNTFTSNKYSCRLTHGSMVITKGE